MLMTFGTGSFGYTHPSQPVPESSVLTLFRLNLTQASHVHIVDPQWNPMIEEQAAARSVPSNRKVKDL